MRISIHPKLPVIKPGDWATGARKNLSTFRDGLEHLAKNPGAFSPSAMTRGAEKIARGDLYGGFADIVGLEQLKQMYTVGKDPGSWDDVLAAAFPTTLTLLKEGRYQQAAGAFSVDLANALATRGAGHAATSSAYAAKASEALSALDKLGKASAVGGVAGEVAEQGGAGEPAEVTNPPINGGVPTSPVPPVMAGGGAGADDARDGAAATSGAGGSAPTVDPGAQGSLESFAIDLQLAEGDDAKLAAFDRFTGANPGSATGAFHMVMAALSPERRAQVEAFLAGHGGASDAKDGAATVAPAPAAKEPEPAGGSAPTVDPGAQGSLESFAIDLQLAEGDDAKLAAFDRFSGANPGSATGAFHMVMAALSPERRAQVEAFLAGHGGASDAKDGATTVVVTDEQGGDAGGGSSERTRTTEPG